MLQRGARVVDLVEIRAVAPGGDLRHAHRLVAERLGAILHGNVRGADAQTVDVKERHLADLNVLLPVGAGIEHDGVGQEALAWIGDLRVAPLEHVAVCVRQGADEHFLPVLHDGQLRIARVEPGEIEHAAEGNFGVKMNFHALAVRQGIIRLGRGGVAEIQKRDERIHCREHENRPRLHGALFDRGGHGLFAALRFLRRYVVILADQAEDEKQHHERDRERREEISQRIQAVCASFPK